MGLPQIIPFSKGGTNSSNGTLDPVGADVNVYVSTIGNDTTGDGSAGNPMANIYKSFRIGEPRLKRYLSNQLLPRNLQFSRC